MDKNSSCLVTKLSRLPYIHCYNSLLPLQQHREVFEEFLCYEKCKMPKLLTFLCEPLQECSTDRYPFSTGSPLGSYCSINSYMHKGILSLLLLFSLLPPNKLRVVVATLRLALICDFFMTSLHFTMSIIHQMVSIGHL